MASNNLNVLMQKLYSMEKTVGGGKGAQGSNSTSADEFNTIKQTMNESLSLIRKKMDDKDEKVRRFGNSPDVLKMNNEIKEKIQGLDKQLSQMNEVLRKQKRDRKRYGVSELEIKEKHYNNFLTQVKEVKARERGVGSLPQETQMKTFSEMKSDLMGKGERGQRAPERELTSEEAEALDRFAENDKKQDEMLDIINGGLEKLKGKASNIGTAVARQTDAINKLDTELDVAYKELESSNNQLKKVLVEYRKPSKFCMDICLLFVLIGLIGTIVKLAQM